MTSATAEGTHRLDVGPLDLVSRDGRAGSYAYRVMARGFALGSPEAVLAIVKSLLGDGDLNGRRRDGNRKATFVVQIGGDNLTAVAAGERALALELDRAASELRWTPPGGAPTSVFSIVNATMDEIYGADFGGDVAWLSAKRAFTITLECLPYTKSADAVTTTWSGGYRTLLGGTLAGWTVVSGAATQENPSQGASVRVANTVRLRKTITAREYLWFKLGRANGVGHAASLISDVTLGGVAVPTPAWRVEQNFAASLFTIPTGAWRNSRVVLELTLTTPFPGAGRYVDLRDAYTLDYPAKLAGTDNVGPPVGVFGRLEVAGSARCPCVLAFTVPAGGAFVWTGANPDDAIRRLGASERLFSRFTVAAGSGGADFTVASRKAYFNEGDHVEVVGYTDPQTEHVTGAGGMWPQAATQGASGSLTGGPVWSYPLAAGGAVSAFTTVGAKVLVGATPLLQQGFHGDSVQHEEHLLYPADGGIGVFDANGLPIPTTIIYTPHWRTNAGQ